MSKSKNVKVSMRILHRYLGFFMAGIMAVYAISGVLLVYRDTDLLKKENKYTKNIETHLSSVKVGKAIKSRDLEFTHQNGDTAFFKQGWYIPNTGLIHFSKKELPFVINQFVNLHKAKSAETLSPLNTLFGVSLFFFVVSSFWMYPIHSKVFKKGIIYTLLGLLMALLLLFA